MNQTLVYVRAAMQRAEHEGARTVEVQIKDLKELLPAIEAQLHRERVTLPMKPGGWVRPAALIAMTGQNRGKKKDTISRYKSEEFNLQVFVCDDIHEKHRESLRLMAAKEDSERWALEQESKA